MTRYQIIRKPAGGRWSFVAHGAGYDRAEAVETAANIERRSGDKTRLLPFTEKAK